MQRLELPVARDATVSAVQALVLNSLDAQASSVGIRYDPLRAATVEDNGLGVTPAHISLL